MTPTGPWVCQRSTPFLFTSLCHCSSLLYILHTDARPEDDGNFKLDTTPRTWTRRRRV